MEKFTQELFETVDVLYDRYVEPGNFKTKKKHMGKIRFSISPTKVVRKQNIDAKNTSTNKLESECHINLFQNLPFVLAVFEIYAFQ